MPFWSATWQSHDFKFSKFVRKVPTRAACPIFTVVNITTNAYPWIRSSFYRQFAFDDSELPNDIKLAFNLLTSDPSAKLLWCLYREYVVEKRIVRKCRNFKNLEFQSPTLLGSKFAQPSVATKFALVAILGEVLRRQEAAVRLARAHSTDSPLDSCIAWSNFDGSRVWQIWKITAKFGKFDNSSLSY